MNCHSKGLYPGCCRNCPKLRGMGLPEPPAPPPLPVARSNPMPVLPVAAYIPPPPPAFMPAMAVADVDETQPMDGKVAVTPVTTEEPETDLPGQQAELEAFLAENAEKGQLRIQAFRGQQVLPAPGVHVVISRFFDGQKYVFYEGDTDQSGIIDGITLPAAPRDRSLEPGEPQPSAAYDLVATHPLYQTLETTVDIYQDIKTTQMLQMRLGLEG